MNQIPNIEELTKKLQIVADMINMGEKIRWGQETTLMDEAADALDNLHHQLQKAREITEDTSDGYHTFKELYEFRLLYNAALFNEWAKQHLYDVHKSEKHSDGEFCFGGDWFIVMATLPTGQISNHYPMSDWDLFKCRVQDRADVWDGHTSQDVAQRLREALTPKE